MAFLYRINRVKGKIVKNFLIISVISGIFIFNINSKSQSTTYQKKQIVKIYYNSPKELDELRKLLSALLRFPSLYYKYTCKYFATH